MNCGKEEKEFLPVIKILLDNGIEKKGKLIEFFDSDVIEIENEGQREFILWNKIDGISFPTEGKEGN
jgi:sRNA-binding regulator protein Hfq